MGRAVLSELLVAVGWRSVVAVVAVVGVVALVALVFLAVVAAVPVPAVGLVGVSGSGSSVRRASSEFGQCVSNQLMTNS